MQEVLIQLHKKQSSDGTVDESRLTYRGKGARKAGGWFVAYQEDLEGAGQVQTVLRIGRDDVELIRYGPLQMKQRFTRGESTWTWYDSPFGRMRMEAHTRKLRIERERDCPVRLAMAYQVWLDGQYAGDVELDFRFAWEEAEPSP